jgi:hypothetical protein
MMLASPPLPLAARLRVPGYILCTFMALLPLVDFFAAGWPVRAGQLNWRFSSFGTLSATVVVPLVALLLMYALALALADRKMLYFALLLTVVYVVLLLIALASFPLDALQMRRRAPAPALARFTVGSMAAILRLGAYALTSLVLAVSIFRSIGLVNKMIVAAKADDPGASLVMRSLGPTRPTPQHVPPQPVAPEAVTPET